jgi:ABC-type antimicrobial peptide transport system permease subunit
MLETFPTPPVPNPVFEIVGVVADAKNKGIQQPPVPEAFIPYTLIGNYERGLLVRTAGDPLPMLDTVRREIWAIDPNIALTLTGAMPELLKTYSYAEPRFSLVLLGVFAAVGLVLVVIGVSGVMAYSISRQTQEIGVRMALGASSADMLAMVLRTGFQLIAMGIAIGLAASFALTRLIASQLWGVSPHDPMTLCAVVGVVILAGLAACYLPARRAIRVDPMRALRSE